MKERVKEFLRRLVLAFRVARYVMKVGPPSFIIERAFEETSTALEFPLGNLGKTGFIITEKSEEGVDIVVYKGMSGRKALMSIESLRRRNAVWSSMRDGKSWDWGPR